MTVGAEARPPVDSEVTRELRLDRRGRVHRWAWRAGLGIGVAALAIGGWMLYRFATRAPPVEYQTAAVLRDDVEAIVDATGTVEPLRTVWVGPEVSGRIAAVHADFNDVVHEGQVLAEIDPEPVRARRTEAQARLRAAHASLQQARASRGDARRTLARYRPLEGTGAVSGREVDAARAALEQADAAIASARAQIALAQATVAAVDTDLSRTTIRSPVDGVVLQRQAEPGQAVAATFQPPVLFTLAEDLSRMDLHLAVDEADIGHVEVHQTARFTVDAFPGRSFSAVVISVRNAATTVQGVVTYEVILRVDDTGGLLRPGMTASAQIVTSRARNALVVPNAALRFTPPGNTTPPAGTVVWVRRGAGRDGVQRPQAVPVERGISDGQRTAVRGELEPGDTVLVDVVRPEE